MEPIYEYESTKGTYSINFEILMGIVSNKKAELFSVLKDAAAKVQK